MKVVGVVAEYNPFHTGHEYQLQHIRKELDADFIIVIMSGDFVQRGAPAILSKYTRAKMALSCGADLVLELPVGYATGSAEYFAYGAIWLLDQLQVVDQLHFGSECGDVAVLQSLANIFSHNPEAYQDSLHSLLKEGHPFPLARQKACLQYLQQNNQDWIKDISLESILDSPNNILGIEYCKTISKLNSRIQPVTIKRLGTAYNDETISDKEVYPSATAVRKNILQEKDITPFVPQKAFEYYKSEPQTAITENDFSAMLHYKLLSQQNLDFSEYLDITPELSDRIANLLPRYTTLTDFCMLLKSKNYTYTRISRCMFHILLNIKTIDVSLYDSKRMPQYVRTLGFRKDALPLLSAIKQNSKITLLSKLSDYKKLLSEQDQIHLSHDLHAYHIYHSAITAKSGLPIKSEFTYPNFPL